MINLISLVLLAIAGGLLVSSYNGPDLPPGPYCGLNFECCKDRIDACSHRILDTRCYCDEFCNRTSSGADDCCPDYPQVCRGELPSEPNIQYCHHRGEAVFKGQTVKKDCNECTCRLRTGNEYFLDCEKDTCLLNDDVVTSVNQERKGWRAYNYPQYRDRKLKDGLIYMLGTLPLSRETKRMGAIRYDKNIDYPHSFDARSRWPEYITPVMDQGWCGSDWAVSTAAIASDRFAIQSNGAERLTLSPQTLLSCSLRQQQGCAGGHIDVAWNFARSHGLVDEECLPYQAARTPCLLKPKGNLLTDGCRPSAPRTSRYKVGPPGLLKKEIDIMYDIMESGPVQAIMTVYQDFFSYRDGIYRHTRHGDNRLQGLHSVRIVGWGEERGQKYWTVANSWGRNWGEEGYFRIARGDNESGIESFVVTVLSDVSEANRKK